MFDHADVFRELDENVPLAEKLRLAHEVINRDVGSVDRVAVALYEPKTDLLKTFLHSSGGAQPLPHYSARLADAPALREIVDRKRPRLIPDLSVYDASDHEHTRKILAEGYAASYTLPMFLSGRLFGFVFFNSYRRDPWPPEKLHYLDLFGHLIALLVMNEISSIRTLLGAIQTSREFAHERDPETGAHLDRMSRYARLIAQEMAIAQGLSDGYVEHVFLFAPLHDLGKVAIPDAILLKPGKLTPEEYEVMKTHSAKGRAMIDALVANFGLEGLEHVEVLRNIAGHHHEALDGSGYPAGLRGEAIPLEARVVAVADVFDALTSRRPYKPAWSNDEAFAALRKLAGKTLDADCVAALERRRTDVERIQAAFREDTLG